MRAPWRAISSRSSKNSSRAASSWCTLRIGVSFPPTLARRLFPFDCSKGRYTTSFGKSSIHSFRLYLLHEAIEQIVQCHFAYGDNSFVSCLQSFPKSFLSFRFGLTVEVLGLVLSTLELCRPPLILALINASLAHVHCLLSLSREQGIRDLQANPERISFCGRKIILSVARNTTFGGCAPKSGVRRFFRFAKRGGEGGAPWIKMESTHAGGDG